MNRPIYYYARNLLWKLDLIFNFVLYTEPNIIVNIMFLVDRYIIIGQPLAGAF